MERRDQLAWIALAQGLRRYVLIQEKLDPVEKLGGGRLLLEALHLANVIEDVERLMHEPTLETGEVHIDYRLHRLAFGKFDIVEKAAPQERVGQFLFIVRGDDDDRPLPRLDGFPGLVDEELHAIEFLHRSLGNSISALSISSMRRTGRLSWVKASHNLPRLI